MLALSLPTYRCAKCRRVEQAKQVEQAAQRRCARCEARDAAAQQLLCAECIDELNGRRR